MHFDPAKLTAAFELPENYEVTALLVCGFPAEDAEPMKLHFESKNVDEIVSYR